jgi:hypothetical protein
MFVVHATGTPQFLPTIGYEWTEAVRCDGLEGVGFMASDASAPPRVLLLYSAASPNAASMEPVVLDWDALSRRYVSNEKLSRRLEDDDKATTIAGMKRQLRSYQGSRGPK